MTYAGRDRANNTYHLRNGWIWKTRPDGACGGWVCRAKAWRWFRDSLVEYAEVWEGQQHVETDADEAE